MKTGRPVETEDRQLQPRDAPDRPGTARCAQLHPMAFNPTTGLVYIPAMQQMFPYSLSADFKKTGNFARRDMFWNPGIDWNTALDATEDLMRQFAARCRRIAATSRPGIRCAGKWCGRSRPGVLERRPAHHRGQPALPGHGRRPLRRVRGRQRPDPLGAADCSRYRRPAGDLRGGRRAVRGR